METKIHTPNIKSLFMKETSRRSRIATTHPDRAAQGKYAGDILSKNVMIQIKDWINNNITSGDKTGSFRQISLFHDWVKEQDPTKQVAGILKGDAEVVQLEDGHFAVEADFEVNKYLDTVVEGQKYNAERVEYEIDNGYISGLSIEYEPETASMKEVELENGTYRFIDSLTTFAGQAFARARLIANPAAIAYKEITSQIHKLEEETNMVDETKIEVPIEGAKVEETKIEETKVEETTETKVETTEAKVEEKVEEKSEAEPEAKPEVEQKEIKLSIKELLESKEMKTAIQDALQVKSKVAKEVKEEKTMENLSIKEMNAALDKNDVMAFNHAASKILESKELGIAMQGRGVEINNTLQVKANGRKLEIVNRLETKDVLDTDSNPSTYTQNSAELGDIYRPGILDTFNNQINTFGSLRKVDNAGRSNKYGWEIFTTQDAGSDMWVDANDNSVNKENSGKIKLQTEMKVLRKGISVSDYTAYHADPRVIGNLFQLEINKKMGEAMKQINKALFGAVADTGSAIMGYEGVANSAAFTTIFGLSRTTANRLAPATATDTYEAIGGAITAAKLQGACTKVEIQGANRSDLVIRCNPAMRDKILNLYEDKIRYSTNAIVGFNPSLPILPFGVPLMADSDCPVDQVYVTDDAVDAIVVSKAPMVTGLAKVSAAESAYVEAYLAHAYDNVLRIHMLDTLA